MSDMLERPTIPFEGDGTLDDSNEYIDPELDGLLASLAEDKLSFEEIPYGTPFSRHESLTTLASKKVLTQGSDARTPLSNFRNHLSRELQTQGYDEDAADDATVIVSELVGNVRLHGAMPNEKYSGECRVRTLKHSAEDDLGRSIVRVTTVIEAINFSDVPASSQQEQDRDTFEGGNGLDLVRRLAEAHGGEIGRYRVIKDRLGHETYVPEEVSCGNFVVWAALHTEITPEPAPSPTEI